MPPTFFGYTCGHPQGGALQMICYKKLLEPMHKCKILSFKMHDLRYVLKYKIQIKFCD